MAFTQQVDLVSNKFFNDLSSPVSLTANTFGPTNGHYLITPNGDGVPAGIRTRTITIGGTGTSLTTCVVKICADAAGKAVLGYASGTVISNGGTDYTVAFNVDVLAINANIPAAVKTLLSTADGRLYLLFKTNVDFAINYTVVEWESVQVG